MANSCTNVTTGISSTSSLVSGSFTSVLNGLYFITIISGNGSTLTPASWSAMGLGTVTQVLSQVIISSAGLNLYWGVCTSAATGTLSATVDTTGGGIIVDLWTGNNAATPVIITNQNKKSNASASPVTINQSAPLSTNGYFCAWGVWSDGAGVPTMTPKNGYTTVKSTLQCITSLTIQTAFIALCGADTTPNDAWTLVGGGARAGGICIEVKTAVVATTIANSLMMMGCGI